MVDVLLIETAFTFCMLDDVFPSQRRVETIMIGPDPIDCDDKFSASLNPVEPGSGTSAIYIVKEGPSRRRAGVSDGDARGCNGLCLENGG